MNSQDKNIVFLLGAGFNQELRDFDNLKPPMANNFFRLITQSSRYRDYYHLHLANVYDFIQKYWKINEEELARIDFNLEKLFTYLQLEYQNLTENHLNSNNINKLAELDPLIKVDNSLTNSFVNFLQGFDIHSIQSPIYMDFAKKVMEIKPDFLTFNYDLILEQILQSASGVRPNVPASFNNVQDFEDFHLPDDILRYSHFNYNIPLAYAFKSDIVRIYMAGVRKYESGERFYSLLELYDKKILKLHGSLNWVRIIKNPVERSSFLQLDQQDVGKLIISDEYWDLNNVNEFRGWKIVPHIITPVLYKSEFYKRFPFEQIWQEAREILSNCKILVVIGYSFPPTDFHVEKLFLDSFRENELEKLVVVNPDTSVVGKIKNISHFKHPVIICSSLKEFMDIIDEL